MDNDQVREYRCATCYVNFVIDKRIQHTVEEVLTGDTLNCNLDSYSDHRVEGGELFVSRPDIEWVSLALHSLKIKSNRTDTPIGGVCTQCLEDSKLRRLFNVLKDVFIKY